MELAWVKIMPDGTRNVETASPSRRWYACWRTVRFNRRFGLSGSFPSPN
jgi:hypothetical protein